MQKRGLHTTPDQHKRAGITYMLARLPIGMSFFGHGLIRIIKLPVFAEGMIGAFSKTLLPEALVRPFAYGLPFIELVLGILLLTGLYISASAVAGVLLMLCLIFGSAFQEKWDAIFTQMMYALYLAALYYFAGFNGYPVMAPKEEPSAVSFPKKDEKV